MYGIFTYIYPKNVPNVVKYSMHGASGFGNMRRTFLPIPAIQSGPFRSLPEILLSRGEFLLQSYHRCFVAFCNRLFVIKIRFVNDGYTYCFLSLSLYFYVPCCSPPARWGLLDFLSTPSPSPPSPPPPRRTSTTTIHAQCSLPDLNHDHPRPVFAAGPQPRPSTPSVRCRTSTTTSHAQCSLPDLNHDHPRPVFAAGPQPRPATPSVRCRTSTTTIHAQCSLPDLNSYAKSYAR